MIRQLLLRNIVGKRHANNHGYRLRLSIQPINRQNDGKRKLYLRETGKLFREKESIRIFVKGSEDQRK